MKNAMVVAPQSEAADVAFAVLADGGNAFDAAVAAAFAQAVADPHRCGIGGFGAATLYDAKKKTVRSLSFFGRVGADATPDMWVDRLEGPAPDGFGYIIQGKENDVGYRSITVPGMVAGLEAVHRQYCTLPWRALLAPAAALARRGFLVGPGLAAFWRRPGLFGRVSTQDRLGFTDAGRAIWLAGGAPPEAGDRVKQPLLADTYDRLGKAGPRDFYEGELGRCIASDFDAHDALVTANDLRQYQVTWEKPVAMDLWGRTLHSTPLPGGGIALFQCLKAAQMHGAFSMGLNSAEYVDLLARIFSAVQHDRTTGQSDPAFTDVDAGKFLRHEYLAHFLDSHAEAVSGESPDTTQLGVVDGAGNGIILSHSLGYGSGVFTDGLGFMYNNCMSGFDPVPGGANDIAPGKARSTAIAQTALVDDQGRLQLIIGSPGGSHITAALTQALINHCHFGLELQDAACRPRFDAYRRTLLMESRMPFDLEDVLAASWTIQRSPRPFGMVGRVYGIAVDGDRRMPAFDPGEPGTAREV